MGGIGQRLEEVNGSSSEMGEQIGRELCRIAGVGSALHLQDCRRRRRGSGRVGALLARTDGPSLPREDRYRLRPLRQRLPNRRVCRAVGQRGHDVCAIALTREGEFRNVGEPSQRSGTLRNRHVELLEHVRDVAGLAVDVVLGIRTVGRGGTAVLAHGRRVLVGEDR